jgi:hypothetical protein
MEVVFRHEGFWDFALQYLFSSSDCGVREGKRFRTKEIEGNPLSRRSRDAFRKGPPRKAKSIL